MTEINSVVVLVAGGCGNGSGGGGSINSGGGSGSSGRGFVHCFHFVVTCFVFQVIFLVIQLKWQSLTQKRNLTVQSNLDAIRQEGSRHPLTRKA